MQLNTEDRIALTIGRGIIQIELLATKLVAANEENARLSASLQERQKNENPGAA